MTRTQTVLYRARHGLWTLGVLLFLGGAVAIVWLLLDRDEMADRLAQEADLRGMAVSTLASDVRELRAQVQAEGATPVAPDPTRAVEDLPDRAEVPVPIPGPRGATGAKGEPGEPGASGSPGVDGVDGETGKDGVDGPTGPAGPQGEQGPTGPAGRDGEDGADGRDGTDGQTCPDGYSLQAPSWDPDALVCRRDGAPNPEPTESGGLLSMAGLDPNRKRVLRS